MCVAILHALDLGFYLFIATVVDCCGTLDLIVVEIVGAGELCSSARLKVLCKESVLYISAGFFSLVGIT